MRHGRTWLAVVLAAVCVLLDRSAHAQSGAQPSERAMEEASAHFQRGVELYQDGAFRAALVEFERAYQVSPDYRLLYNIGQVKYQLQDYLGATQSYERYLAEGGNDIPESRRNDVERAFETLRQRVGRVAVTASRDGVEVFIDDQRVGFTPITSTIAVNVGRHRVSARGDDGATASEMIDIAGGDVVEVKLELKAPEIKPAVVVVDKRKPLSLERRIAVASWAVGGAALVAAIVTGVQAKGKVDDRNAELDKDLPNGKKVSDLGDSASTLALTTDILGGLAVVGVAAGTVLWLMGGEKKKDSKVDTKTALEWGIGPGTLTARGRF